MTKSTSTPVLLTTQYITKRVFNFHRRQLGWDYHKTRQMWILVRGSVAENLKKDEPNSYCVFNKDEWKKEIMELSFDYSDLENENDRNLLF